MRKVNPEHISAILEAANRGPLLELLSMVIKDLGVGYSFLELEVERKHLNPFGGIHGGVYASLIDTATYWAAYCEQEEDSGLVTLDLKLNLLAPIKEGIILAKGKSIKVGKSTSLAEAVLTDREGKILAQGTSTLMVTPGRQTIKGLFREQSFPPKFLDS